MSASSQIVVHRAISRKALARSPPPASRYGSMPAPGVAHEKALIIDRRVTIMGSYNRSKGAVSNSEDLNVVTSSEVAETYARHWQARQTLSFRFANASQWCRG